MIHNWLRLNYVTNITYTVLVFSVLVFSEHVVVHVCRQNSRNEAQGHLDAHREGACCLLLSTALTWSCSILHDAHLSTR